VLLIAGMFLDPGAAIILLAPILVNMADVFGIHVLHMAMIVCLNLTLGVVTPPVGVCLYVGSGIGKISIERVVKAIMPFVIIEFICILIVTYFPMVSMLIPTMAGLV
jgi:C4-dicarboxylate transporter DctM subunit